MKDRDTFILENMGLVRMVANKYKRATWENPVLDYDDLVSLGSIGLVKAHDNFNPAFKTRFSTYAVSMIEGEILRFLRDHGNLIRLPRGAKQNIAAILKAGLINEKPTVISKALNMLPIDVKNAISYHKYKHCDCLDSVIYEDENGPITLADKIGIEQDMDLGIEAERIISQFDARMQKVIRFRMQGLSQAEIGKIIGVSQVQVSRLLNKARRQLKDKEAS